MENQKQRLKSGKGFVTIATGDIRYYQLAVNLLRSYRLNSQDPAPFALICDRECAEAREFDDFVLVDNPHCSYLDKLSLCHYAPYEEVIFIDADALILRDTRVLWEDYADKPPFSCYGTTLPLDSRNGWFFYEDMGDLKPYLTYGISMHGGLYYLRKSEECDQIFTKALDFAKHYDQYRFACFAEPADEPVLALSMALAGCKPCPARERILFLPSHDGHLRINKSGKLMLDNQPCNTVILHFGNRNLPRFLYQYLLASIEYRDAGGQGLLPASKRLFLKLKYLPQESAVVFKNAVRKLLPGALISQLKKIRSSR